MGEDGDINIAIIPSDPVELKHSKNIDQNGLDTEWRYCSLIVAAMMNN